MKTSMFLDTVVGSLLLCSNGVEVTGLYFADCKHVPREIQTTDIVDASSVLHLACEQIQQFLSRQRTVFSIPLRLEGTQFQERIWSEISKIPFGQTISYSELASRVDSPKAVRAAGTATGANPLSIIIPCHRVVGKNNAITGYAGGIHRKTYLLELEQRAST